MNSRQRNARYEGLDSMGKFRRRFHCGCESLYCREPHVTPAWRDEDEADPNGRVLRGCQNTPVGGIHAPWIGPICAPCAKWMPKDYLYPPHGTARRG